METLKGKIVVIAGASGGIGAKAAKLVSTSGAIVYIAGRNKARLQIVAAACQIPAEQVFEMDITNEAAVNQTIEQILLQAGHIDILVNAAGIGIIKPVENLLAAEFIPRHCLIDLLSPPVKLSVKADSNSRKFC